MLACDASAHDLGFVLNHLVETGHEYHVASKSRTIIPVERNYFQSDREAFAVVSGVKKLPHLLCGCPFRIYAQDKQLLG